VSSRGHSPCSFYNTPCNRWYESLSQNLELDTPLCPSHFSLAFILNLSHLFIDIMVLQDSRPVNLLPPAHDPKMNSLERYHRLKGGICTTPIWQHESCVSSWGSHGYSFEGRPKIAVCMTHWSTPGHQSPQNTDLTVCHEKVYNIRALQEARPRW
jgi:hypothetical protein